MTPRRVPFGSEPAALPSPTGPVSLEAPQETAPLADFVPPESALPFSDAPPDPAATEPVRSLVPPPPRRAPGPSRASRRTAGWVLLLVADLVVLGYLLATWRR